MARGRAVARLDLRPGDTVLDVACGAGENFALLAHQVGERGLVVGVDFSPEMLAEARARVRRGGWQNIELIEGAIEEVDLPLGLDAALFSFNHDVVRSPQGVENVLRSLAPGARIGAVGGKWAPWPATPANLLLWLLARRAVTTFEGFRRPWSVLAELVPNLEVEPTALGGAYIASGRLPMSPSAGRGTHSASLESVSSRTDRTWSWGDDRSDVA